MNNGIHPAGTDPANEGNSYSELLTIPLLGAVRAKYLADAGISTIAALMDAGEDKLAAIKWIGIGNARRIKAWLAAHPPSAVHETPLEDACWSDGAASADDGEPELDGDLNAPALPPEVLVGAGVVEEVGQIDSAIHLLQEALPKKARGKKLGRQLTKVATSVSVASAGFDDLNDDSKQAASKALDRIAQLLSDAVESGKLSARKQESMGEELKKHRKRLKKALGG